MKRQMNGTSPHSDEASLVGNQPLSFELDRRNGIASTSGDSLLHSHQQASACVSSAGLLTPLIFKMFTEVAWHSMR